MDLKFKVNLLYSESKKWVGLLREEKGFYLYSCCKFFMAEIKFKVPEDFREFFKVDPLLLQIAFQRFVEEKLEEFKELERIAAKSKLTEEEALELGKLVNKSLAKRYERLLGKK